MMHFFEIRDVSNQNPDRIPIRIEKISHSFFDPDRDLKIHFNII